MNPDVVIILNISDYLEKELNKPGIGVTAPLLVSSEGIIQDNARKFPTSLRIFKKIFHSDKYANASNISEGNGRPNWVAGMFMMFKSQVYQQVKGLDERFYLYYEDADLWMRLRKIGYRAGVVEYLTAIHDSRRSSHKSLQYLRWHLICMVRFFFVRYPSLKR